MKKSLKSLIIALTLIAALALSGCSKSEAPTAQTTASETKTEAAGTTTYKIGLCNYVSDASLNQIVDNIRNELAEIEKKENVKFEIEYENCNADANVLAQIVTNFKTNKVDLMIGIATPVVIQMQASTEGTDLPVIFAAVSDPVGAGIVSSLEKPGSNITGTSDALNTDAIVNILLANDPSATKVALLYDAGQDASTKAIADAKALLGSKGVQIMEYTATSVDEAQLAVDSMIADKVNAVFTPTDNTIMTAELSIYEKLAQAGIPHYCGADSFALNGAFLGFGVDYAQLGVKTADMAADVLLNHRNPAEVPVETFDNGTATINVETCTAIGLSFDEVKNKIQGFCTSVNQIHTAESFD